MRTLTIAEQQEISAAIASITETGDILVTDYSKMIINGFGFNHNGQLFDPLTDYVYFDFSKDGDSFYYASNNNLITAIKIEDGYIYKTEGGYKHIY